MNTRLAVLSLLVSVFAVSAQDRLLIRNAWLVDGTGATARKGDVLVEAGRIAGVGQNLSAPAGTTVIEAEGQTLLPGLFDLHTHIGALGVTGGSGDWLKSLMAYSWSGVTTVADLGAYPEQYTPVRRILSERPWAPRLHQAARFSSPGGHGLEGGRGDFHTQAVLTPREARAAVRRIAGYRPDIIKVFSDGWRYGADVDMTSMEEAALTALVDEAHKNNLKVITHTVTVDKAKVAARAGVDMVGHGLGDRPMDQELIDLMKAKGSGYVQTLAVYEPRSGRPEADAEFLTAVLGPDNFQLLRPVTAPVSAPRRKRWEALLENSRRSRAGGVLLGSGTDAGMAGTYHGWAALHELELMVQGGLSPLEALTAATGQSARLLGVDGRRGTLREGLDADLVLVSGKPFEDIRQVYQVSRVWVGGKEVNRPQLAAAIAAPGPVPLPSTALPALLDDFERADGRSRIDTLWLNATDGGHDHARMSFTRTLRRAGDHALTVLAEMTEKDDPRASVVLPLTPGAVEPADARAWRGIEFDFRGEGDITFLIQTRGARRGAPQTSLPGAAEWKHVRLDFTALRNAEGWTPDNLTALEFRLTGKPGGKPWLEIDNVGLFQ